MPDYSESDGFNEQLQRDPQGYVAPARSSPGSRTTGSSSGPDSSYRYSNTDNIVVAPAWPSG